jgi:hypothetical protein
VVPEPYSARGVVPTPPLTGIAARRVHRSQWMDANRSRYRLSFGCGILFDGAVVMNIPDIGDEETCLFLHPIQLRAAIEAGYVVIEAGGMFTQNLGPWVGRKRVIEIGAIPK